MNSMVSLGGSQQAASYQKSLLNRLEVLDCSLNDRLVGELLGVSRAGGRAIRNLKFVSEFASKMNFE